MENITTSNTLRWYLCPLSLNLSWLAFNQQAASKVALFESKGYRIGHSLLESCFSVCLDSQSCYEKPTMWKAMCRCPSLSAPLTVPAWLPHMWLKECPSRWFSPMLSVALRLQFLSESTDILKPRKTFLTFLLHPVQIPDSSFESITRNVSCH